MLMVPAYLRAEGADNNPNPLRCRKHPEVITLRHYDDKEEQSDQNKQNIAENPGAMVQ